MDELQIDSQVVGTVRGTSAFESRDPLLARRREEELKGMKILGTKENLMSPSMDELLDPRTPSTEAKNAQEIETDIETEKLDDILNQLEYLSEPIKKAPIPGPATKLLQQLQQQQPPPPTQSTPSNTTTTNNYK